MKLLLLILTTFFFMSSLQANIKITCDHRNKRKWMKLVVIDNNKRDASYKLTLESGKYNVRNIDVIAEGYFELGTKGHKNGGEGPYTLNYMGKNGYLILSVDKEYNEALGSRKMHAKGLLGLEVNGETLYEDKEIKDCVVEAI